MHALKEAMPDFAYLPCTQTSSQSMGTMVFELCTVGDPLGLAGSARRAVQQADSRAPISNINTQERGIDRTISQERTFATLCTCFAVLAVRSLAWVFMALWRTMSRGAPMRSAFGRLWARSAAS